jgi:hypothetical protein
MQKIGRVASLLLAILALVSVKAFLPHPVLANDSQCSTMVKTAPMNIKAVSGPSSGQVTLFWDGVPHANRYAVSYGIQSNKYVYGATDIGNEGSRSYTVSLLNPGTKYFFRLAAARDCSSGPFSVEVSAYSGSGGVMMPVTAPKMAKAEKISPAVFGGVGKQKLTAVSGPKVGEVTLYWQDADSADNYHLMYGTQKGKYQYGALRIGKLNKFTVSRLEAGKTYFFALVPLMGDRTLYTTPAIRAVAKGLNMNNAQIVVTSPKNLIKEQPFKAPKISPPAEVLKRQEQTTENVIDATPTAVIQKNNVKGIQINQNKVIKPTLPVKNNVSGTTNYYK